MKEKQPWRITRVERIEAARQKIRNADWTVEDFLNYLKAATAANNEWNKDEYKHPPELTVQRCRSVMTKVAKDMGLTTGQKRQWKFKKSATAAEIREAKEKQENKALKKEWLASLEK